MTSVFCVICRDNQNTNWVALSCGHVCHERCLTDWFNHNRSCPSCRRAPNRGYFKIYFESQEWEFPATSPAAAASAIQPEDPQEVQQLRDLLFNETQEREAGWKQAHDSAKNVSRLEMELQGIRREAQMLREELASCRTEKNQKMQLLEQKEWEIYHLNQKLQFEEQQNSELNCALVAHEESSSLSIEGHVARQLELEAELESEKQRRRQHDSTTENLTLIISQSVEQKRVAEQMARDLNSRLNAVQSNTASTIARLQARQRELEETIAVLTTVKDDCERELIQARHGRQQDATEAEKNAMPFRLRVEELQSQKMELEEKVTRVESINLRELFAEKQRNQQLMETYAKLKVAANETVNEQKAMILKALEQQKTLENDNEALRRLLNDKETEIGKLKSDLRNKGEIELADLTGISDIYSEVDSAGIGIFNGGKLSQGAISKKEDDNFADFSIFPVVAEVGMSIDPCSSFRPAPAWSCAASSLNASSESSRQHDTTRILNSTLQDARERYLYDSPAAMTPLASPLKQPESVCYSHIGNSSSESTANWCDKLPDDKSCHQNEAALKGNPISTDQKIAEERLNHNVGLRQQLGTDHFDPANPVNEASKRPLFASSSDLRVRHLPSGNTQPTTKYNLTERTRSTTNLNSTGSSVTTEPAKGNQTRTQEPEEQEEEGVETVSSVKSIKHSDRFGKEKSKKHRCKQM